MVTKTDLRSLRIELEQLLLTSSSLSFQQKSEYLPLVISLTEEELLEAIKELKK